MARYSLESLTTAPDTRPTYRRASYPMFHTAIVGLSPSKLHQFKAEDMKALCEAFELLTGDSPLVASAAVLLDEWKSREKDASP